MNRMLLVLVCLSGAVLSTLPNGCLAGDPNRILPHHPPKRMGIHSTFVDLFADSRPMLHHRLNPSPGFTDLRYGERVDRVTTGSPAWRAGLERGDVIVAFYIPHPRGEQRRALRDHRSLREAIARSGSTMRLLVRNVRNGRYQQVMIRFNHHHGATGHHDSRPMLQSRR